MRISDWSSDVCSSDLVLSRREHHVMGVFDAVEVVLIGRVAVAILPTDAHHFARVVGIEDGPVCFRSEEHTSELQSLMRISYAVFCLKKKNHNNYLCKTHNSYNFTHVPTR